MWTSGPTRLAPTPARGSNSQFAANQSQIIIYKITKDIWAWHTQKDIECSINQKLHQINKIEEQNKANRDVEMALEN